jgi:hypothetical protein
MPANAIRRIAVLAALVVPVTSAPAASAAKAPGCRFPAAVPFYFVFGQATYQPQHEVPGTRSYGLTNTSNKPVPAVMTLNQQVMNGFSVSASVGVEAGAVFAKVKTQVDRTASKAVTSGATVSMPVTVPAHKRAYIYWAMPTRRVTYHTYMIYTDCTIITDYGSRTATWLTGSTALHYVGYQSA